MDGEGKPAAAASALSRDHGYIQRNPASAYWALSPYLIHQHTDSSCSLATATMLLNGMRAIDGTGRMGRFFSERGLIDAIDDPHWLKEITPLEGNGISFLDLAEKLRRILPLYDFTHWAVDSRAVRGVSAEAIADFRAELTAMERDGDRLLAANYHLATTYGDQWDIGHFSPVGAYDAATDRVLLLDVWKADYEPSWVDLTRLMQGMATISPITNNVRGYLIIRRT
ncbi:MAG TPA: phytochelatin synthase family protein [Dongiaceae bacterium]